MNRCQWALASSIEEQYHDSEWGVPLHDDGKLFEFLLLEGQQAGLSWRTILDKRENFRSAFDGFNAATIAAYDDEKVHALLANPAIIRNRLKIRAAISNARAYLAVQHTFGSFDRYIWQFVDGKPIQNHWQTHAQLPAYTIASQAMSADLQRRGFKFVGKTICYAFMQAVGMVNDHVIGCYRHAELTPS